MSDPELPLVVFPAVSVPWRWLALHYLSLCNATPWAWEAPPPSCSTTHISCSSDSLPSVFQDLLSEDLGQVPSKPPHTHRLSLVPPSIVPKHSGVVLVGNIPCFSVTRIIFLPRLEPRDAKEETTNASGVRKTKQHFTDVFFNPGTLHTLFL